MKRLFTTIAIIAVLSLGLGQLNDVGGVLGSSRATNDTIASAIRDQTSGVHVVGEGVVAKVLPDDRDGSRHQRFILSLDSGQTVLVAHNIDLAPRLASLRPGDTVQFDGVYEWNEKGGVVHWTHRDPSGRHDAGWLKHNGVTSQ